MRQMPYISRQRFPRDRHDGFIHKISRIQDVQTNAVLCQPSASVEDTTPNAEAQDRVGSYSLLSERRKLCPINSHNLYVLI